MMVMMKMSPSSCTTASDQSRRSGVIELVVALALPVFIFHGPLPRHQAPVGAVRPTRRTISLERGRPQARPDTAANAREHTAQFPLDIGFPDDLRLRPLDRLRKRRGTASALAVRTEPE